MSDDLVFRIAIATGLTLVGIGMAAAAIWRHRRIQAGVRVVETTDAFMNKEQRICAKASWLWMIGLMLAVVLKNVEHLNIFGAWAIAGIWAALHTPMYLGFDAFKSNPKTFTGLVMLADVLVAFIISAIYN